MKHRRITLKVPASVTPEIVAQLRAILEGPAKDEALAEVKPGEWMPGRMAQVGMEALILPGASTAKNDKPGDVFTIGYIQSMLCFKSQKSSFGYFPEDIEVRWPVANPAEAAEPEPVWRPITPEDVERIGPGDKLKVIDEFSRFDNGSIVSVIKNDKSEIPFHVSNGKESCWKTANKFLTCMPPAPKPEPEPEPTPVRDFIWRKVEAQDVERVKIGDHLRLENNTFGHDAGEIVTVSMTDNYGDGWPFRVAEIDLASMPYSVFSRKVFGSWQPLTAENIARVKVGDRVRIDGKESATVTAAYPVVERVQLLVDENGNASPFLRWEFCGDSDWQCDAKFFIPDADNE